ncbi:MAG: nucleotidyltransferase family protein, partial [Bacteroidota bacterium]
GWENRKTGDRLISRHSTTATPFAFSGIHVINPCIFSLISEEGRFSLTDLYLRLARDQKITGYEEEGAVWKDVGRFEADR